MQSVKSYFNKTLYLHDLKRGWPIWASYLVIWFFIQPFSAYGTYDFYVEYPYEFANQTILNHVATTAPLIAFVFAILAAMSLFHYLYQPRSANTIHSLPLRREGHFLTHYAAGLTYFVVPNVLIALMTLIAEVILGYVNLPNILLWLGLNCLIMVFFFSLAVFCAQFTGHILALPAFYAIWNFVAYGLSTLVSNMASLLLYGYNGGSLLSDFGVYGSPLFAMARRVRVHIDFTVPGDIPAVSLEGGWLIVIYAVVGVALTFGALAVYRRRNIETAGDVVAIPWAKPIFRYGVALFGGILLGFLMCELFYNFSEVFFYCATLFWGLVSYYVAEMLLQKSFRVFKRSWKGAVGYAAAILIVVAALALDITGFEQYQPALENIEEVCISHLYTYPSDSMRYNRSTLALESEEDIATFLQIHKTILQTKNQADQSLRTRYLSFTYFLKDGTLVSREYEIPVDLSYAENPETPAYQLLALYNEPQRLFNCFFPPDMTRKDVIRGNYFMDIYDEAEGLYRETQLEFNAEEAALLYDAVLEDLAAERIGQRRFEEDSGRETTTISIVFYGNFDTWRYGPSSDPNATPLPNSYTTEFVIEPQSTATNAVLELLLAEKE